MKYQEKLSSESRFKAEQKHVERKYALQTMMEVTFSDTIGNLLRNLKCLIYGMFYLTWKA